MESKMTDTNTNTIDEAVKNRDLSGISSLADIDEDEMTLEEAEALSRQTEARANTLARKAQRDSRYESMASEAVSAAQEAADRLKTIQGRPIQRDLSGMSPTLSDYFGNFAPSPEVAMTGGIGVVGSNSTADGEQAQTLEDIDLGPAGVGVTNGDQPVGDPAAAARAEADRMAAEADRIARRQEAAAASDGETDTSSHRSRRRNR